VKVVVWPWLFRLPWFRQFDGWSAWNFIALRRDDGDEDLLTHELCHVWQMQHKPISMPLSYLGGYWSNPHEVEARRAVDQTR
jgi:hypothetical protein